MTIKYNVAKVIEEEEIVLETPHYFEDEDYEYNYQTYGKITDNNLIQITKRNDSCDTEYEVTIKNLEPRNLRAYDNYIRGVQYASDEFKFNKMLQELKDYVNSI